MRCALSTEKCGDHSKPTLVTTQSVKLPATMWTVGVLFGEGAGYFSLPSPSLGNTLSLWLPETTFRGDKASGTRIWQLSSGKYEVAMHLAISLYARSPTIRMLLLIHWICRNDGGLVFATSLLLLAYVPYKGTKSVAWSLIFVWILYPKSPSPPFEPFNFLQL